MSARPPLEQVFLSVRGLDTVRVHVRRGQLSVAHAGRGCRKLGPARYSFSASMFPRRLKTACKTPSARGAAPGASAADRFPETQGSQRVSGATVADPLSHFPPGHAGVKPCGFAAVSFFFVRCTAVSRRNPSAVRTCRGGSRPALRAGLPKCGEIRAETPEQEGLGPGARRAARSRIADREEARGRLGKPVSDRASRGSAKPAPMTLRCGNVRAAPPLSHGGRDRLLLPLPGPRRFHDGRGCAGGPDREGFSRWGSAPPAGGW